MQLSSTLTATLRPPTSAAFTLLERLAQALPTLSPEKGMPTRPTAGTLTPAMIRATLLEMGAGAAEADVALASALAQTGLPLTPASLAEAYGALARAPGAIPEAYALAKALALPTTPDALKALTTALTAPVNGLPKGQALPEPIREWLGLEMEAGAGPEILARHLRERMLGMGRGQEDDEDAHTLLLHLALGAGEPSLRAEADALARHLEGQQWLNQAAVQAHVGKAETPLYLAVPLVFGEKSVLAEMQVWVPNRRADAEEEEADAAALRVTVRVALPRLGRVQAELSGGMAGSLSCRLGVENAGTQRLLARHTGALAAALSDAGWQSCDVCCRLLPDWPPLWHGGEILTTPRSCVDQHV